MRKLRSAYSNAYLASAKSMEGVTSLGKSMNKMHLVHCPMQLMRFKRFALGYKSRMGKIVKPDRVISIEQVLALMMVVEDLGKDVASYKERRPMILLRAFVAIVYTGSFCGYEVFLVDTHGPLKYKDGEWEEAKDNDYVLVPLLGRFKDETGEKYYLTSLVAKTYSGLEVRKWVKCITMLLSSKNRSHSLTFSTQDRRVLIYSVMEAWLVDALMVLKDKYQHLSKQMQI
eukprot:2757763-Ditylum_brightwellii.AAC.1